jgi:hypothetical protein
MVRIREFLIGDIPRSAVRRGETIHPQSHSESLQYGHRSIRVKIPIIKSPHHTECDPLTDIRMIPLRDTNISEASLSSSNWTHSLGSEEYLQHLGTSDRVVRSEPPIIIPRYDTLTRELLDGVAVERELRIRETGKGRLTDEESRYEDEGDISMHREKLYWSSIITFAHVPNIFR